MYRRRYWYFLYGNLSTPVMFYIMKIRIWIESHYVTCLGYNINDHPISRTMRVGLYLILVLYYFIPLCDFSRKNASEMHCLIEILYLHAYCFCCKLCKMCQSSFFSNSPQILWGLADEGCNLVCQIEIPWLLLLYRGRMLHKSQNEVASQLFLLHSYHQSKIYGCQSRIRAPLHADIICAVLCYHAAFR